MSADSSQLPPTGAVEPDVNARLELLIRNEVLRQLSQELTLLKGVAQIAIKAIAVALITFGAIFTLFGLTTWQDIKRETAAIVRAKTEKLIQDADSETGVKQTLDELLNRTITASSLTRLAVPRDVELSKNEGDRLRAWIKLETISEHDFADALKVLASQPKGSRKDVNSFLSEMLNPPKNSPFRWILKQPEKQTLIMDIFVDPVDNPVDDPALGRAAADLATSDDYPTDLRIKAIQYIRKIKYVKAADRLLGMGTNPDDGGLDREALVAGTALKPQHPQVAAAIERISKDSLYPERLQTASELLVALAGVYNTAEYAPLHKKLLSLLFENEAHFEIDLPSRSPTEGVRLNYYLGRTTMSFEDFDNLKAYWGLLTKAADAGKVPPLANLLPHTTSCHVALNLSGSAQIAVKKPSGEQQIFSSADHPLCLRRNYGGDLFVATQQGDDRFDVIGTVQGLSGNGFEFSFKHLVKRDD